jgi:predicted phosphohydrolase
MKTSLSILMLLLLMACGFGPTKDDFYKSQCEEDYCRIPLIQPADLVRLNGDTMWGFSLTRAKIDSPIISALVNVRSVGINFGKKSFIVLTDEIFLNKVMHPKSAIIVIDPAVLKKVDVVYGTTSVDSLFQKNKDDYQWHEVNHLWNTFNNTGKLPWF